MTSSVGAVPGSDADQKARRGCGGVGARDQPVAARLEFSAFYQRHTATLNAAMRLQISFWRAGVAMAPADGALHEEVAHRPHVAIHLPRIRLPQTLPYGASKRFSLLIDSNDDGTFFR